jgi:hypothetical protein
VRGIIYSDAPKSKNITNPTELKYEKFEKINALYFEKLATADAMLLKIENMIDMVDGWERTILRLKYINGWTWDKFEAMQLILSYI